VAKLPRHQRGTRAGCGVRSQKSSGWARLYQPCAQAVANKVMYYGLLAEADFGFGGMDV